MKIEKEVMKINEIYELSLEDTFKIEKSGISTNIMINDKRIKFVTKIQFQQSIDHVPLIRIERLFMQEDFDKINKFYSNNENNKCNIKTPEDIIRQTMKEVL